MWRLVLILVIAVASAACNRASYPNCLGGSGRIVAKHQVEIHGALMTFIMGHAWLEDDANRGMYEVANIGEQRQVLLSKIYSEAARKGLHEFKTTVSLKGYEFTCARCGEHYVMVSAISASEPTQFTDLDSQTQQERLRPFVRKRTTPRECQTLLT